MDTTIMKTAIMRRHMTAAAAALIGTTVGGIEVEGVVVIVMDTITITITITITNVVITGIIMIMIIGIVILILVATAAIARKDQRMRSSIAMRI